MLKNIGLNLSSLNYYISRSQNRPNIIKEFSDIALKHNLDGVEFYPSSFVKKRDHYKLDKIYKNLHSNSLFYILDCDKIFDLNAVKDLITSLKLSKKKIIVIVLTKILECKRHLIKKDWDDYIEDSINFLKKLEPIARDHNVKIAIENHQDFDSNDFIKIMDSFNKDDTIGINFDIGNAFAVCEDPMVFCKKIVEKINNVHVKDYNIKETKEGFMLSNCAIGKGSVKLKPIINFIEKKKPNITKMLEPGQLSPRHIKKNNKVFWKKIGSRLFDEKKKFENSLSKAIFINRAKNFKNFSDIKNNDEFIFKFLKNQIIESIDYSKKL
jgi:sugar phosphate isomerase/epimerase|tara:strand:- start:492 stop:1466 length:975 start_codon:yes stop_codon:yes gene_type:complete